MSFLNHFDDITNLINESKSVDKMTTTIYGTPDDIGNYCGDGPNNPISFYSLDEGADDLDVVLRNVLHIDGTNESADDLFFNTRCVGYAVENGYDNVIVETTQGEYCIAICFEDEDLDITDYITEAGKRQGPLAGKKISKEKRAELKKKKTDAKKHSKLNRPTATSRPKKSPEKGMKVDVLLANTGKLSPDRVERAMKQVRKQPPKLTGVKEIQGAKYFRAEYNFNSVGSSKRQIGYADVSQDKQFCSELFCSCSDFFYRLYAPYVAAGLSTWNIPPKYKAKQNNNVSNAPHNHRWTVDSNPMGKLFLCKHLWAFLAYYLAGDAGNMELTDEEIEEVLNKYFDDVDGDGEEEVVDSEFMKAFGKLYVGQQGKEIEHIDDKDKVKKGDRKQTFYQLPGSKDKDKTTGEVANDEEE